jgi:hypothetical protein
MGMDMTCSIPKGKINICKDSIVYILENHWATKNLPVSRLQMEENNK